MRDRREDSNRGPQRFALIIGAMKSGTTTLFELLAQHPEIEGASSKEPDFFSDHADPVADWPKYRQLWGAHVPASAWLLEASTSYSKGPWVPDVPRRIAGVPDAEFRFIYLLRHPLRRIESQVRHGVYQGWGKSLGEGITDDLVDYTRYAMQMDRYFEVFPRDRMLCLLLDDLRDSPGEVLARCCSFLGVNEGFGFEGEHEHRNTGDFFGISPALSTFARPYWVQRIARTLLPPRVRRCLRTWLGKTAKQDAEASGGRWKLTEDEADIVWTRLAPDLRRLRDTYGIPVQRWSPPPWVLED